MNKLLTLLDRCLFWLLALLMTSIVLDVCWQVITRFVLASPSAYTEELARFLLIWIGILGAAFAFRHKAHLGLDLVTSQLTGRPAQLAQIAGLTVSLVFALVVMVYGGFSLMSLTLSLKQTSAALGLPMGYVYSVLPLSGALIAFYCLVFLRDALRAPATADSPTQQITEQE